MDTSVSENQLYERLKNLSIQYSVLEHNVITTMEEGKEIMEKLTGCVPVNLLLKDKSGKLYFLIKDWKTKIKFSDLDKKLGTKGLTMVKQNEMTSILKVPIGCATIFALMHPDTLGITILLDDSIATEKINFHPMRNNATLTLGYEDMIKFLGSCGQTWQKISLK